MSEDQNRPRDVGRVGATITKFRPKHLPTDCWIDSVSYLDLYLAGTHRARVTRSDAQVTIFDQQGGTSSSFVYLLSDSAYDAVEKHLVIERVKEIRDASDEGGNRIGAFPRDQEAKEALDFRSRYQANEEALKYVWDAARAFNSNVVKLTESEKAARERLLDALVALAKDDRAEALDQVRQAIDAKGSHGQGGWCWMIADKHCSRAMVAIERDIALQAQL